MELEVIRPRLDLEAEFLAMATEIRAAGVSWFEGEPGLREGDFAAYVRWLQDGARGVAPNSMVPWTALWLVRRAGDSGRGLGTPPLDAVPA